VILFKFAPKIFGFFNDELPPFLSTFVVIIVITVMMVKPVREFLQDRRYAESQNFADILAREWQDNNGITELEAAIEALIAEWKNISESWKRVIHSAEHALTGSDKELLNYFNKDKKAKNWYIENIYDRAW
jgi:hypothetical protein